MKTIAVSGWIGLLLVPGLAAAQKAPQTHELRASPATVHRGFFDASLKPVLTIDSGDIVRLETASGNPRYFESLGVPKARIPAELYAVFEGVEDEGRGDSPSMRLALSCPSATATRRRDTAKCVCRPLRRR